jgi:hypothetical protein
MHVLLYAMRAEALIKALDAAFKGSKKSETIICERRALPCPHHAIYTVSS